VRRLSLAVRRFVHVLFYLMLYPALDEAKAAYQVWLDVRAKRDEMLTEKQNKKPAPYRHVKVDNDFVKAL